MIRTREWINIKLQSSEFHPQLCCNFDQVWSLLYAPKKSTLQMKKGPVDELAKSRSMRAIRHVLERSLDIPYTESLVKDDNPCPHKPTITGGASATGSVEMWRVPRTVTTLSWRDGVVGRGFITCRDDSLTSAQRDLVNQARGIVRWVFLGIQSFNKSSHVFWFIYIYRFQYTKYSGFGIYVMEVYIYIYL